MRRGENAEVPKWGDRRRKQGDGSTSGGAGTGAGSGAGASAGKNGTGDADDDSPVHLDDEANAWWAQRDELTADIPRLRPGAPEPLVDAPSATKGLRFDEEFSVESLFDFMPGVDLDDPSLDRDREREVAEWASSELEFEPAGPAAFGPDDSASPHPGWSSDGAPAPPHSVDDTVADLFRDDDPYAVLGVPSTATWDEIVEAHRALARLHHPDVLVHVDPERRAASEARMRDVNLAYAELRHRRGK